jgi:hypothetical protein
MTAAMMAAVAAVAFGVGNGRKCHAAHGQGQCCRPYDEHVFHAVLHFNSLSSDVQNLPLETFKQQNAMAGTGKHR